MVIYGLEILNLISFPLRTSSTCLRRMFTHEYKARLGNVGGNFEIEFEGLEMAMELE
jgi:hypothetical protein